MSPAINKHAAPMDSAALHHTATLAGPCITVTVPAVRPGADEGTPAQILRSLVKQAASQVAALKLAEAVPVLKRLEEFASDLATYPLENWGFALFCSPAASARYLVRDPGAPRVVIGSHPYLEPFLNHAYCPRNAVVLCLSRKELRLFEFLAGVCRHLALPPGLAANYEGAGAFDVPDHRLENRSAAGSSMGARHAVSFGTTSERENRAGHIEHFFALADRAIRPLLANRPLILAGVHEETAAYRRVSHYEHLLDAELAGNWDFKSEAEIASAAEAVLAEEADRFAAQAFVHFEQKLARTRTLTDADEILVSAAEGRVHQLFVRRGSELYAQLPPDLDRVRLPKEDLVNACLSETLRHDGEVYELPQAQLPVERPLAAILRY